MPLFPQRPGYAEDQYPGASRTPTPMEGTPTYTDRDLPRFARNGFNIDVEQAPQPAPYVDEGPQQTTDDLLNDARSALMRANLFEAIQGGPEAMQGVANLGDNMDALVESNARRNKPTLRSLTEFIRKPVAPLGAAALATGVTGIGAPATPFLAGAADLFAAPDVVRRLVAPDPDESRGWAAGEGLLMGLGARSAIKGLRGALNAPTAEQIAEENLRIANQAERDLVDSYAAQELASGSQARPPAILRRAHEKAGRIHGETPISHMTQIAETQQGARSGVPQFNRSPQTQALADVVDSRISGLPPEAEDLISVPGMGEGVFAGPVISRGMGSPATSIGMGNFSPTSSMRRAIEDTFVMPSSQLPRVR